MKSRIKQLILRHYVKNNRTTDCGNSPKMALLRDFTSAFVEGNESLILDAIADTVRWEMVGQHVMTGKEKTAAMLKEMLDGSIEELVLQNILKPDN